MGVNVLILDGHPDEGRLLNHLLDHYQRSLSADASVVRINLRDLSFDLNLRRGYSTDQPWEPDLQRVGEALAACDHLAVGFPLWWGAEPALVKGLVDRLLLPGFAFKYHPENVWWDGLLAGRSADLIVATDTPNWYLKLVYGDPLGRHLQPGALQVPQHRGRPLGLGAHRPETLTRIVLKCKQLQTPPHPHSFLFRPPRTASLK